MKKVGNYHVPDTDSYFDEDYYYSDKINYSVLQKEYSKRYIDFLNEFLKDNYALNVSLVFTGLYSPREYNFTTDEIEVNISDADAALIIDLFSKDEDCISFIDDASSSCPGFASFYEGYNEVKKDNEAHLRYIFKYIDSINDDEFEQYYDFNCMYELIYNVDFLSDAA